MENDNKYSMDKPWIKEYREGDNYVFETNLPNDTIGDMAFEYDFDGSERKAWEKYLMELEAKGIRGQLVHRKMILQPNQSLDRSDFTKETPLESYKMVLLDVTKNSENNGQ